MFCHALLIGVSRTSLMVGGFRSQVLLALLEDESAPPAIHRGTDRLWY